MMIRLIDKLHDTCRDSMRRKSGFTLAEMLAALVVITLLTGIVAMGVSVGLKIYQNSMFVSESEALSSTIDSAMSGPLRYAERTSDGSHYSITYRSVSIGSLTSNEIVKVQDGKLYWGTTTNYPLLNDSAYTDCKVASASVTPAVETNGEIVFSVTYTLESNTDSSRTKKFGTAESPIEYQLSSLKTVAS